MYADSSDTSFETNKILGGIGALLTAIGSFLPFQGAIGVVAVIGVILILLSARGLSETFKEESIYRNSLYGLICGIIATGIGVGLVSVLFGFLMGNHLEPFGFALTVASAILGLVVVSIFFLVEAIFFRQAFNALADKSGEAIFRTGGLLLLLGAVLTVFIIGFVLLFVGWLLIAVGFFSMRSPAKHHAPVDFAEAPPPEPTQTAPPAEEKKFCTYCGAENQIDAIFCVHCGKKLNGA